MQDQASKEIYRDPATGLPMHSHAIPVINANDGFDMLMPSSRPCPCGNNAFDVPYKQKETPLNETTAHLQRPPLCQP